jgi:hypothetical protein
MINQSQTYTKLVNNLSEISRLESEIRKEAFSNTFLIKEISIRRRKLDQQVRKAQINAYDYSAPLILSEELIKMLRPVFDKYHCLRYAQFIDDTPTVKC